MTFIEAAQHLIQENNFLVGELQPPYLGQTSSFTIETGKFNIHTVEVWGYLSNVCDPYWHTSFK